MKSWSPLSSFFFFSLYPHFDIILKTVRFFLISLKLLESIYSKLLVIHNIEYFINV